MKLGKDAFRKPVVVRVCAGGMSAILGNREKGRAVTVAELIMDFSDWLVVMNSSVLE